DHIDRQWTVLVSAWLETQSPRIGHQLTALGVKPIVVDRREVLTENQPPLEDVDGILTPVSSTHNAHKRAYSLVERSKRLGITTFSMQHGIENPGLTFFDAPLHRRCRSTPISCLFGFPQSMSPRWCLR